MERESVYEVKKISGQESCAVEGVFFNKKKELSG